MAIMEGFQKPKGHEDWSSWGRFQAGLALEVILEGGAEPGEVGNGLGVPRVGTNSREASVSVMSTVCSRRLEGGQPDVWPLERGPPLFSECGLSALKRTLVKDGLPHHSPHI